jgi:hypothetical protein
MSPLNTPPVASNFGPRATIQRTIRRLRQPPWALDNSNNVIVTGSALTIKYDASGNQLWTAPYAGTALAVDSNANVYVCGYSQDFATIKLTPQGSNVWVRNHTDVGATLSQCVLVDNSSNVYVAGSDTYYCFTGACYQQLLILKYDQNGNQLWVQSNNHGGGEVFSVNVRGAALDSANNFTLIANFNPSGGPPTALQYSANGSENWISYLNQGGYNPTYTLACDTQSNTLVAGAGPYAFFNGSIEYDYTTIKLDTAGNPVWTNSFPQPPIGSSVANAIAVDAANNAYVTGYSPGVNSGNDIVTIKYDPNGNKVWLQRYKGLGNGNDAGNAIAVDGRVREWRCRHSLPSEPDVRLSPHPAQAAPKPRVSGAGFTTVLIPALRRVRPDFLWNARSVK